MVVVEPDQAVDCLAAGVMLVPVVVDHSLTPIDDHFDYSQAFEMVVAV